MTAPVLDEVFGDYRLTHLLGKGGMASVFRAVRSGPMGFAKQVAIKRLHPSLTRDSTILKALVNEARIGGQLKHPNIVEIYEFNRVGDTYFLAMEFIDGWTLDRVLHLSRKYKQALPQEVMLDVVIQICEGLHYAHTLESLDGTEVHLVHRDLKPANIILGRDGVTKIMDFGIAKADTNLFKTTVVDVTKGTPHYMSPEQVGGDPNLTATSDIFALGSLLYELTTDEILFNGDSLPSVLFAVSRAEVQEEIDAVEAAMPGLGEIVRRCLQKEPAARYPSAKALKEALVELRDKRQEGAWTTQNYMYTLRSKVLEESVEQQSSADGDEVEFAPLISRVENPSFTEELSVDEAREAADAEIDKLQSQYLSEALTQTLAVDSLEQSAVFDPAPSQDSPRSQEPTQPKRGSGQTVLLAILAFALLVTLAVIGVRTLAPGPGEETADNETASTAAKADNQQDLAAAEERTGSPPIATPPPVPTEGPRKSAAKKPKPKAGRNPAPVNKARQQEPAARSKPAEPEPSLEQGDEQQADTAAEAAEPAPTEATAATAVSPQGMGKLGVRGSTPSSTVFVDGRLVGKTPLMPIPLSAGTHSVRLHCATAGVDSTKTITVTIEDGKTLKLGKYNFMTQQWK